MIYKENFKNYKREYHSYSLILNKVKKVQRLNFNKKNNKNFLALTEKTKLQKKKIYQLNKQILKIIIIITILIKNYSILKYSYNNG